MSEEEPDKSQSEQTGTTSSKEDTTKSYTKPDFETLGSVAAIAGLMGRRQQGGGGGGGGRGRGGGGGGSGGPSARI